MEKDALEKARQAIDRIDGEMARLFQARMERWPRWPPIRRNRACPSWMGPGKPRCWNATWTGCPQGIPSGPITGISYNIIWPCPGNIRRGCWAGIPLPIRGAGGFFPHRPIPLSPTARALACPTFEGVFAAVQAGRAAHGVLPFENSQAGDVAETLDLCMANPGCYVQRMYDLPVTQNLLGLPGAALGDIRRVLSHPQALGQCREFLLRLGLEGEPRANTAIAAQEVAGTGDLTLGAIASRETAELYGLQVLCPDISRERDNTTRFMVIGKEPPQMGNRFSLLFTIPHVAGPWPGWWKPSASRAIIWKASRAGPCPIRPGNTIFIRNWWARRAGFAGSPKGPMQQPAAVGPV